MSSVSAAGREFCTRCGRPQNGDADHMTCATALQLEPARFCPQCARRMVVQVTPSGWTARCSQHGELASV